MSLHSVPYINGRKGDHPSFKFRVDVSWIYVESGHHLECPVVFVPVVSYSSIEKTSMMYFLLA